MQRLGQLLGGVGYCCFPSSAWETVQQALLAGLGKRSFRPCIPKQSLGMSGVRMSGVWEWFRCFPNLGSCCLLLFAVSQAPLGKPVQQALLAVTGSGASGPAFPSKAWE